MAAEADTTMAAVVDEAVLADRRQRSWADYQSSHEAHRDDPRAWDARARELQGWDATLADGLEDEPDEQTTGRPEARPGRVRSR